MQLSLFVTFLACPRKVPKEGHPAEFLNGMLNRPQYISETACIRAVHSLTLAAGSPTCGLRQSEILNPRTRSPA